MATFAEFFCTKLCRFSFVSNQISFDTPKNLLNRVVAVLSYTLYHKNEVVIEYINNLSINYLKLFNDIIYYPRCK